jgi:HSP20 family protein
MHSMTNLARWDPIRELASMDPFRMPERLFDDRFLLRPWGRAVDEFIFPLEISEGDDQIEVRAALPGVRPEDVEVSIENGVLHIRGEMRDENQDRQRNYHRREIVYGRFERLVTLPSDINADQAEARFENGMLVLRLPKAESARARQIPISGGSGATSRTIEGQRMGSGMPGGSAGETGQGMSGSSPMGGSSSGQGMSGSSPMGGSAPGQGMSGSSPMGGGSPGGGMSGDRPSSRLAEDEPSVPLDRRGDQPTQEQVSGTSPDNPSGT